MSSNYWKTRYITQAHQNPWFSIEEHGITRHNDTEATYYVVIGNPSAFVVPMSSDGQIYLIKQYRYPNNNVSWELPAGAVDSGESPLEAAKRELLEETGIKASKWEPQGCIHLTPGLIRSVCTIFKASDLVIESQELEHVDEAILECRKFQVYEIKEMIQNGEMTDGASIAVLGKVLWT
jgi:8-oxo-dGTP pyrophosphatase MutT (NUDIX family)